MRPLGLLLFVFATACNGTLGLPPVTTPTAPASQPVLPANVKVPLPAECRQIVSVDVVVEAGTVRCKAVCAPVPGQASMYLGSCTADPQWRTVQFVKP